MSVAQKTAIGIYVFATIICIVLLGLSEFMGPSAGDRILTLAGDSFKIAFGALLGAGSILMGGNNGRKNDTES